LISLIWIRVFDSNPHFSGVLQANRAPGRGMGSTCGQRLGEFASIRSQKMQTKPFILLELTDRETKAKKIGKNGLGSRSKSAPRSVFGR